MSDPQDMHVMYHRSEYTQNSIFISHLIEDEIRLIRKHKLIKNLVLESMTYVLTY